MKVVLQRVLSSHVEVDGRCVGAIQRGWLVLLAIGKGDDTAIAEYLADRCLKLRAFPDDAGKMNLSAQDVGGSFLVVSQFTLYGDCTRGRRPGFDQAAAPSIANELYEHFCNWLRHQGASVQQGVFQADMKVHLINDGPVTFVIEKCAG
jgi:D-tyrosyl-tRNA(Tyr) deacylase